MTMLEKIIGIYKWEDKATAPSTTNITFKGPEIGRDRLCELLSGFVSDYTTANKKLILGVRRSDLTDRYLSVKKETNTYSIEMNGRQYLITGERPIAIVESPTASDVLYCAFYGIIYQR